FRSDHDYLDGRHPEQVRFESDPREDVLRRDFTINRLMMDPDTGNVLDFIDGRGDLARGVIRAIGDPNARFREDHLRLLRAVRFATTLEFAIDPETLRAGHELRDGIKTISAERVRDELSRIFLHPNRVRGFDLLVETG